MNAKLLLNYIVTIAEETPRTLLLKCAKFNGCFTQFFFTHKVGSFLTIFYSFYMVQCSGNVHVIILHHENQSAV